MGWGERGKAQRGGNTGVAVFCLLRVCFVSCIHLLSAVVSRNKFVLSEPTVSLDLFLSQGPVANSLSEKQNFQRSHEAFANTFTLRHITGTP